MTERPKDVQENKMLLPPELHQLISDIHLVPLEICDEMAARWPTPGASEYVRGVIKNVFIKQTAALKIQRMEACDKACIAGDFELADRLLTEAHFLHSILQMHIIVQWKPPKIMQNELTVWEVRRNFVVVCREADVEIEFDDDTLTDESEDIDETDDDVPAREKKILN